MEPLKLLDAHVPLTWVNVCESAGSTSPGLPSFIAFSVLAENFS